MTTWSDKRSIHVKLLALALALALPVVGLMTWLLVTNLNRAREAAYDKVSVTAKDTTNVVAQYLQLSEATLAKLASRPLVKAMEPGRCDPALTSYIQVHSEFATFVVRDRHGRLVCSYLGNPIEPFHPQEYPWFVQGLQSPGLYASNALVGPQTKRWVSTMTHPVYNDAGEAMGLLILPVDLLRLGERLRSSIPNSAGVVVVDSEGTVLLRNEHAANVVGSTLDASNLKPTQDMRQGFLESTDLDGVPHLAAYQDVPGVQWRVIAGLPTDEVFAGVRAARWRMAGVGTAMLLLAVLVAWRLGSAIIQPIANLAQTAAAVAAGNTEARALESGPTEIEAVAREFNLMLDARDMNEARLRGIFESATDAIITLDENQIIVMANPAASAMFGYPLAAMIGAPHDRLLPPPSRATHMDEVKDFGNSPVLARQMSGPRTAQGLRANGEIFPVDVTISHLNVGSRRMYTAIMRDVTEQQRAENALRESEARLRQLLAFLPDAVLVNTNGRISFCNDAAQRLLGESEASLLGRSPLEFFHEDSMDLVRSRIKDLRDGAIAVPLKEFKLVHLDGSIRMVEATAVKVQTQGVDSILLVMRDVTMLKRALSALEITHTDLQRLHAAQLTVQEEERQRIARELHDDLQQTLGAMRINTALIAEHLGQPAAEVLQLLTAQDQLAASAIESSRRIINDLRPQMLEDLGLAPALQSLADQFSKRQGVVCRVTATDAANDLASRSASTTTCLYRLTQEALNNVAKHAKATRVDINLSRTPDGKLSLTVRDNGKGFNTGERRRPSSFGLLGIHERVRALDGTVHVESSPGYGTAIKVTLPVTVSAA